MAQVSIHGFLVEQSRRDFGEGPHGGSVHKKFHGVVAPPAEGLIGQAVALVSRGQPLLDVGMGEYRRWDDNEGFLLFRSGVDPG